MDRKILYLKKCIESDLKTKYTNEEMAAMIELNVSRFQELFKNEIGVTPKQFLQKLRMERAKELLETTFEPVQRICYEVGINDQRNFARDFKKMFGMSPTEYAQKYSRVGEVMKGNDAKL